MGKDITYRSKPMFGLKQGVMNLIEDSVLYNLMVEAGHIEQGQVFIEREDGAGGTETVTWRFHPQARELQHHPELESRVEELALQTARQRGKALEETLSLVG